MIPTKLTCIGLAASLAAILPVVPAHAAGRTFVSSAGSDSNPCTITLPCRNLQAAYNAVAANGEVDVLDPGNYGALTIIGPVNIQGHGWAGMSANSGAAITINSAGATDKITIRGVVLDGLGIAGTTGIQFNSGGSLNVHDSVVRNFAKYGIQFEPSSSGTSQLYVSNTLVSNNGDNGIFIEPGGSGTTQGVLNRVEIANNQRNGILFQNNTQTVNFTVSDSVIANSAFDGIGILSGGGTTTIMMRNSTSANNGTGGVEELGGGGLIRITRSTITANATGWSGNVESYGDNNIDGNGSANTEPMPPLPYH